ncbi:carbonic anhydrase-like [Polypterus senegalus]|uniref:carbonic anhydrase-like n=1 Tax=Polypterus senegalus TaxID=55291 RepID=UPI001962B181|nr:carbonic anhydrase-like [Polypterus senegalus]
MWLALSFVVYVLLLLLKFGDPELDQGIGHPWCYENPYCGPSKWKVWYKKCGGSRQSPINIVTSQTQHDWQLGPMTIWGPLGLVPATANNNGHSVSVKLGFRYRLRGAGLPGRFYLDSFHFHFGKSGLDEHGSEHLINGRSFPLEMHLVFYNGKYYRFEYAKRQQNGLAVVAVLYKFGRENLGLESLMRNLPSLKYKGQSSPVSVDLAEFLPHGLQNYYRYKGSLTTPPCTQNVLWTVLEEPAELSPLQYKALSSSLFTTGPNEKPTHFLQNNYRPPQPLNGRTVSRYKE